MSNDDTKPEGVDCQHQADARNRTGPATSSSGPFIGNWELEVVKNWQLGVGN
jgi:hypothetical protein